MANVVLGKILKNIFQLSIWMRSILDNYLSEIDGIVFKNIVLCIKFKSILALWDYIFRDFDFCGSQYGILSRLISESFINKVEKIVIFVLSLVLSLSCPFVNFSFKL